MPSRCLANNRWWRTASSWAGGGPTDGDECPLPAIGDSSSHWAGWPLARDWRQPVNNADVLECESLRLADSGGN